MSRKKKEEAVSVPHVRFLWTIKLGDVLQVGVIIATVLAFGYTIKADATDAKTGVELLKAENRGRDAAMKTLAEKTQTQMQVLGEKTAGLQTAITFMAPQLQRIEDKLNKVR